MDLKLSDMMEMQKDLYEANKDSWEPIIPSTGRVKLLWMIEEVGEVISIIKKKNEADIMKDELVRAAFVEELADVLMYYNDVLRCYNISSEELSTAYQMKHQRNMKRQYEKEYEELFTK